MSTFGRISGVASQPDLFGEQRADREPLASVAPDQAPPDFVARIRGELEATLRTMREATALPWPDLTRATLAELRFNSIARWLPAEEAAGLRAAFEAEMARLYAAEDERLAAT
jgi:hypothetical protein